jgi:hypothetical protein
VIADSRHHDRNIRTIQRLAGNPTSSRLDLSSLVHHSIGGVSS